MRKRYHWSSSGSSTAPSRTGRPSGDRRGAVSRKTLLGLLLLVAVAYFGMNLAVPYWEYVQVRDAMKQQALVAPSVPDPTIRRRVEGLIDELGLPREAKRKLTIDRRERDRIVISTSYEVPIELPGFVKLWRFEPRAEARL